MTDKLAVERVRKYLLDNQKQIEFLGKPSMKQEKCEVWMEYKGGGDHITYIVSDWGRLHMDNHNE